MVSPTTPPKGKDSSSTTPSNSGQRSKGTQGQNRPGWRGGPQKHQKNEKRARGHESRDWDNQKTYVKRVFSNAQQALKLGRLDSAIELLQTCLEVDPLDSHSWLALARVEMRKGNVDEARTVFRKATELVQDSVHLWQAWGLLEAKKGSVDDARVYFEKGLELEPFNAYICHAWGLLEAKHGQVDAARKLFNTALQAGPQPQVCVALAELEVQLGNAHAARDLFTQALKAAGGGGVGGEGGGAAGTGTKPGSSSSSSSSSSNNNNNSNNDKNKKKKGKKNGSGWRERAAADTAPVLTAWAELEEQTFANSTKALSLLQRACREHPNNIKVGVRLAQLLERRGSLSSARSVLLRYSKMDQAMIRDPRHGSSLYNTWARLESKAGSSSSSSSSVAVAAEGSAEATSASPAPSPSARVGGGAGSGGAAVGGGAGEAVVTQAPHLAPLDPIPTDNDLANSIIPKRRPEEDEGGAEMGGEAGVIGGSSREGHTAHFGGAALPSEAQERKQPKSGGVVSSDEEEEEDGSQSVGLERAYELCEEGIARFPGEGSLHQTLGTVLTKQGRYAEARRSFAKSATLHPTAPAFVAWALMEERWEASAAADAAAAEATTAAAQTGGTPGGVESSSGMGEPFPFLPGDGGFVGGSGGGGAAENIVAHVMASGELLLSTDSGEYGEGVVGGEVSVRSHAAATEKALGAMEDREEEAATTTAAAVADNALRTGRSSGGGSSNSGSSSEDPVEAHWSRVLDTLGRRRRSSRPKPAATTTIIGEGAAGASRRGGRADAGGKHGAIATEAGAAGKTQKEGEEESLLRLELELGDPDRPGGVGAARALFEKGMKVDPTHGPLYNAYGAMEGRHSNVEAARNVLRRGVEARCSDMAHVWHGMATLELQLGNINQARVLFKEGIERFTGGALKTPSQASSSSSSSSLPSTTSQSGTTANANTAAMGGTGGTTAVGARYKRFGGAPFRETCTFLVHSLGMLEFQLKDYSSAFASFASGLELYPNDSHLLLGAALSLMKLNEAKSARDFFQRAVVADMTHAHAWQAWGVFEAKQQNLVTARALFEAGLKECPHHVALWQAYGMLEVSVDSFDAARRCFAMGLQRATAKAGTGPGGSVAFGAVPTSSSSSQGSSSNGGGSGHATTVQLLQAWACLEERAGDPGKARQLIQQAIAKDPSHGPCWTACAVIEEKQGNFNAARRIFEQGLRSCPYHGPLYRSYADMEARRGNYDEARALYSRGLEADPLHAQLFHSFAELEGRLGNIAGLKKLDDLARSLFSEDKGKREAQRALAEKRRAEFTRQLHEQQKR